MDPFYFSFAHELVKVAAETEREKPYLGAIAAGLPVAAVQAATEYPKGWTESKVQQWLAKTPATEREAGWRRGLGRGLGRFGAGAITLPTFMSGIRDIKEAKTREEKARGYAKVLASGTVYAGGKGVIEALTTHLGKNRKQLFDEIRQLGGARTLMGLGSAALTAGLVSGALKKQEEKPDKVHRFAAPAMIGVALGAGKGGFENIYRYGLKPLRTAEGRKMLGAYAGSRAASGAIGALALSEIARHVLGKEKKSSAQVPVAPTANQVYDQVRTWADQQAPARVEEQVRHMSDRGDPNATPTRRAVHQALTDSLLARGGDRIQAPSKVAAPGMVDAAIATAILAAPTLVWNVGIAKIPRTDQDRVLSDALDRVLAVEGIRRIEAGKNFWGNPESYFEEIGGEKIIAVSKDAMPEEIAHELGHATAGKFRRAVRPVARAAYHVSVPASILLPLFAMSGLGDRSFTTKEDLESRARFAEAIGSVSLLLQAPLIGEEAAASVKGVKHMVEAGVPAGRAAVRGLSRMGPALLTYVAPTALPFIVAHQLRSKARQEPKTQG